LISSMAARLSGSPEVTGWSGGMIGGCGGISRGAAGVGEGVVAGVVAPGNGLGAGAPAAGFFATQAVTVTAAIRMIVDKRARFMDILVLWSTAR